MKKKLKKAKSRILKCLSCTSRRLNNNALAKISFPGLWRRKTKVLLSFFLNFVSQFVFVFPVYFVSLSIHSARIWWILFLFLFVCLLHFILCGFFKDIYECKYNYFLSVYLFLSDISVFFPTHSHLMELSHYPFPYKPVFSFLFIADFFF